MYGTRVTRQKAAALLKKGAHGFDVRDAVDFRDDPLVGSINISLRRVSELQRLSRTETIIIVGDTKKDADTMTAALHYTFVYGFTNVFFVDCSTE